MTTPTSSPGRALVLLAAVVTIGASAVLGGSVLGVAVPAAQAWIAAGLPHAVVVHVTITAACLATLVALGRLAVQMGMGSGAAARRAIQVTLGITVVGPFVCALTSLSLDGFRYIPFGVLLIHLLQQAAKRLPAGPPASAGPLSDAEAAAHRTACADCRTRIIHWSFLGAAGLLVLVKTDALWVGLTSRPIAQTLWDTWPEVAVVGYLAGFAAVVHAGRHITRLAGELAHHRRALAGS